MRFRTKTILGVGAIELVMLAIMAGSALSVLRRSNETELVNRVDLGARLLAASAKDAVIAQDLATLDSLVVAAGSTGQLDVVRIVDAQGHLLAANARADIGQDEDALFESRHPVSAGGIVYGEVHTAVSSGALQTLLSSARRWAAGIAGLEIALVALFSWLLGNYLTRQLVALRRASVRFARGDFAERLPVAGDDELAATADAFNRMAEQLGESHRRADAENRLRMAAQLDLELALARAQDRTEQLNAMFGLSPDGLVSFDRQGNVKYANPAFTQLTGLDRQTLTGLTTAALEAQLREIAADPDAWPGLAPSFAANAGAHGAAPRLSLRIPRGAVLELLGVSSEASSVSRLLLVRDVTHEVEVDRMKSEFLSHAAHELRTPLASIYGFTELMMTQEFDADTRRELLGTIYKQSQWLIDIINELLDLARIESRRGKDFHIEAVPVRTTVDEVVDAIQFDRARWPVTVDSPPDLPCVRADAAKLRQSLTNVLSNAAKYSPRGGAIAVSGRTRAIDGGMQVGIAVSDHGIGMTPEQAARVGERFYRADTSGNIPGSGLGMAIVKEVVGLLGGAFEVESRVGEGTTVTLWLPAAA